MTRIDHLIIGQGIAGSLLAYELEKRGSRIMIIDPGAPSTSSKIAAGIINPITGRRLVKSWMYEDLQASFTDVYRDLEQILDQPLISAVDVLRAVPHVGLVNDWLARLGRIDYKKYLARGSTDLYQDYFNGLDHAIFSSGSYQVNLPRLIELLRSRFLERNVLRCEVFDYSELQHSGNVFRYHDIEFDKVVFCEGAGVVHNPFFTSDLMQPSVGERLLVQVSDIELQHLFKRKYFLVPHAKDVLWYGSDTHWHLGANLPTSTALEKLKHALEDTLKVPYEMLEHDAAIRPTTKDRRPLLGSNPSYPGVYFFNGLGTKGASLAPYWSRVMAEHLITGLGLPSEIRMGAGRGHDGR